VTVGNGSSVLVDGANRDRLVWPGDMGIELPSIYLSIGFNNSIKESLNTIYDHQVSGLNKRGSPGN
jgi:hypothetical protein